MTSNQDNTKQIIENQTDTLTNNDWFLVSFVNIANEVSSAGLMGITLLTHGMLVSGNLVSGQEYFKGFAEDFVTGFQDPESETAIQMKESFIKTGDEVYNKSKSETPSYIHLRDAKFFHPNGNPIPSNKGVWWRGRLSEISGFNLGSLANP